MNQIPLDTWGTIPNGRYAHWSVIVREQPEGGFIIHVVDPTESWEIKDSWVSDIRDSDYYFEDSDSDEEIPALYKGIVWNGNPPLPQIEIDSDPSLTPWPLTQLDEIELGSHFDNNRARELRLKLGSDSVEDGERWTCEQCNFCIGVQVYDSRVISVSLHTDATVKDVDLIGLTPDQVSALIGKPPLIDLGPITFWEYQNGDVELTVCFTEDDGEQGDSVAWISLSDYSCFEDE